MKKNNAELKSVYAEVEKTNRLLGAILQFMVRFYTPISKEESTKRFLETLKLIRKI